MANDAPTGRTSTESLAKWAAELGKAMKRWGNLYPEPEHVSRAPAAYLQEATRILVSPAGKLVRAWWPEVAERVVFRTRFFPTLADLQAEAERMQGEQNRRGPNI